MKGLIVENTGNVKLVDDIPVPEINDYEALVKIECCMICNGTDMEIIHQQLREAKHYPLVLGHEGVGTVIKTGKKVRNFTIGDRVMRVSLADSEKYYSGWGSFSEYGVVKDSGAMIEDGVDLTAAYGSLTQQVVAPGITPEQASLMITLKETCSALWRTGACPGAELLIVGDGPVGLSMLSICNYMGIKDVDIVGNHEESLKVAEKIGVRNRYHNKKDTDKEKLRSNRYDFYIDTIGTDETILQGLSVIKEKGTIAVYGLRTGDNIVLPVNHIRNVTLKLVQWPIPAEEAKTHQFVEEGILSGKINTDILVTHRLPLEDYEEGFRAIIGKKALKVNLIIS